MHPLIGIYSKRILPVLKKAIDVTDLKMMRFISNVKHQLIPITNAKRDLFKNINSVAELNELNTNLSQLK
jgi:molybdopterin-guanine dinucleotide biosynthesis protein A